MSGARPFSAAELERLRGEYGAFAGTTTARWLATLEAVRRSEREAMHQFIAGFYPMSDEPADLSAQQCAEQAADAALRSLEAR